jgi:hypothetical protein
MFASLASLHRGEFALENLRMLRVSVAPMGFSANILMS